MEIRGHLDGNSVENVDANALWNAIFYEVTNFMKIYLLYFECKSELNAFLEFFLSKNIVGGGKENII